MVYNNNMYFIIFYLIETVKIIIILTGILEFGFKREKVIYLSLLIPPLFIVLVRELPFDDFVRLYETVLPVLIIITISLIFQGKVYRKVAFTLLAYICIAFFDISVAGILSLIFDSTLAEIVYNQFFNFVSSGIGVFIFALVAIIKKRSNKYGDNLAINKNVYFLFFVGAFVGIFFIASLMLSNLPGAEDKMRKAILLLVILVIFAYFAGCITLIFVSYSRDKYKRQMQMNQEIILAQQKYYTLANEKQQEIKAIKHDMNNHLTCIDALSKGGNYDELHKYIKDLIQESELLEELLDTGNDIVNAIINDAQSRHKERVIIKLKGTFPDQLHILSMDLCVIFSNAISNAIEAIYKINSSHKIHEVNIKIGTFKEDLFIDISNPVNEKVKIVNGGVKTSKEDKNIHGFGLNNMRTKTREYGGSLLLESDENMFYLQIHMKNKERVINN